MHQPQQLMESYYAVYNSEQEEVDTDLYEQVVEYLVSEGYVEDVEEADALIEELDEEVIDEILDQVYNEGKNQDNLKPLQKIRIRNQDPSLVMPPGQQTAERRSYHKAGRGIKKEKGTKSAFGTLRRIGGPYNEQLDTYDLVLDYLMTEGFADDESAATQIMAHMSDEWRDEIVEAKMEAGKSESEKKDIRGQRYADSIGRGEDYRRMGSSAPNWVAAQRRRNTKANRGIRG